MDKKDRTTFDKIYPTIQAARDFLATQKYPNQFIIHTVKHGQLTGGERFLNETINSITRQQ